MSSGDILCSAVLRSLLHAGNVKSRLRSIYPFYFSYNKACKGLGFVQLFIGSCEIFLFMLTMAQSVIVYILS